MKSIRTFVRGTVPGKFTLALSLLALGATLVSCRAKAAATAEPGPATSGATVAYLEGTLTMDGVPVEIGAAVVDGALLRTDANGRAEIVFADKNALRIGPSASLRVRLAGLERSLDIERGTVTAVLRKLDKALGGGMKVSTPSMVAGVRGTSFCAWVSGTEDETYFCTCNGRIEFVPGGTGKSIIEEASHHEALVFSGTGEAVTLSVPGPDANHRHTDADLETLAARIGETMDWTTIER